MAVTKYFKQVTIDYVS